METKASAKFIHNSPRKVRLVVDMVRGLHVGEALDRLHFLNKRASGPVTKLVATAVANAQHNFDLDKDNLYIKDIRVDEAPILRRWMPRAHGRATTIRKRASHIMLTVAELKDSGQKQAKRLNLDEPMKLSAASRDTKADVPVKATSNDMAADAAAEEQGTEIIDQRRQGRHGHGRSEGGSKGFAGKMFRRKSG